MKTSIEWLSQYLPAAPQAGAERMANALMEGGLPVESIEKAGDDTALDVEVTSNRSDCLSHLGVARELGALLDKPVTPVKPAARESATSAASATSVQIDSLDLCPYYSARVLRNVKVGPSPAWMVRRLEAVGVRAINNVADVTNYVLMELGQPLHAFDFDKLEGRRIIVRRALRGERMLSIDGKLRDLTPDMCVIADARQAVAIAGVMGGKDSEVTDGTVNILLESARFDPLSVRRTSRALALRSEASYRFERGLDPTLAELASLRAAQLILETAGGELLGGVVAAGDASHKPKPVVLRPARLNQILGIEVPANEAVDALARLGFAPKVGADGAIACTVPSWRLDVSIEEDLVEEVARVVGYARIPTREQIQIRLQPPERDRKAIETVRGAMVSAGYFEALTFSWVADALRDAFVPPEAAGLLRADPTTREENATLRPSMLAGLLEAVRRNQSVGNPAAPLFEIGSTFWTDAAGRTDERRRLGIVGGPDYHEVRGAVETVLEAVDASRPVRVVPEHRPGFSAAACGRVEWGNEVVGYVGLVDRAIAEKLDLRAAPAAAEIEIAPLIAGLKDVPQVQPLSKLPAVERDLSIVVDERVRYAEIESAVAGLKLEDLEALDYVTAYRGKQVGEGKKSVTIKLTFRSAAQTLTGEQVEQRVQRVVATARERGWTLRE